MSEIRNYLRRKGFRGASFSAVIDKKSSNHAGLLDFFFFTRRLHFLQKLHFNRRAVSQNKVLFENSFNKKSRNADYPEEEFFSADHIDYAEDHYTGFGDYSIVGDEYIESGFAPYAVAIHIVYFAADNSLRIRHFISDSNDDISDVAGKFYEAVSKLYRWYVDEHQNCQLTSGLQTLLDHYEHRTYPGLPTLKKLSIMHHLELMGRYLDGRLES